MPDLTKKPSVEEMAERGLNPDGSVKDKPVKKKAAPKKAAKPKE